MLTKFLNSLDDLANIGKATSEEKTYDNSAAVFQLATLSIYGFTALGIGYMLLTIVIFAMKPKNGRSSNLPPPPPTPTPSVTPASFYNT